MPDVTRIIDQLTEANVQLVAVSKKRTEEEIRSLYEMGIRVFGENRVQDLVPKYNALPKDIQWHMIGHLQTNKVKAIAPFVALIQSLDRESLWHEINKQGQRCGRIIPCLLEIKIARESTKTGFEWASLVHLLEDKLHTKLPYVSIQGVMGMASYVEDETQIKAEFEQLHQHFIQLQEKYFKTPYFKWVSMGMSGDYPLAIDSGSNMVRLGRILFDD